MMARMKSSVKVGRHMRGCGKELSVRHLFGGSNASYSCKERNDGPCAKITDAERFASVMSEVAGHRTTYSDMTGKSDPPDHSQTGTGTVQEPF